MRLKKNVFLLLTGCFVVVILLAGFFLLLQGHIEKQVAQKFYFGKNLIEEKNWKEAAGIFEEIFTNYPGSKNAVNSIFYYALSLKELDRTDEAASFLAKIIEEFPGSNWAAPSLIMLAQIKMEKGTLLEAQKLYEKVASEFKDSASVEEAWLGLGEIYEMKGELAEAKSFYGRVINEFPQDDFYSIARRHLGDLNIKMIYSAYPSVGSFNYKVGSGDTLDSIARRFNSTVDLLKESNQLKSNHLSIGRRLKITPCHFSIYVSKTKNELLLKYNGEIIKIYPVATGKFNSTPAGDFKITDKLKNPVWYRHGRKIPSGHPDNILGSRWLGLSEAGYGIHGTTQPESIGKQATEGCVRMLNKDVDEMYKLVTVGTTVKIVD